MRNKIYHFFFVPMDSKYFTHFVFLANPTYYFVIFAFSLLWQCCVCVFSIFFSPKKAQMKAFLVAFDPLEDDPNKKWNNWTKSTLDKDKKEALYNKQDCFKDHCICDSWSHVSDIKSYRPTSIWAACLGSPGQTYVYKIGKPRRAAHIDTASISTSCCW